VGKKEGERKARTRDDDVHTQAQIDLLSKHRLTEGNCVAHKAERDGNSGCIPDAGPVCSRARTAAG